MEKPEVNNEKLIAYLREIDELLEVDIRVIAVGGTAMTLLGLKSSTIDIDFNFDDKDYEIINEIKDLIPTGFRVDIFKSGWIVSQQLPPDYLENIIKIDVEFKHISLYTIHPLDIVAIKIPRLIDRDLEDIKICIDTYNLTKEQVENRTKQVEYGASEKDFMTNLSDVLRICF